MSVPAGSAFSLNRRTTFDITGEMCSSSYKTQRMIRAGTSVYLWGAVDTDSCSLVEIQLSDFTVVRATKVASTMAGAVTKSPFMVYIDADADRLYVGFAKASGPQPWDTEIAVFVLSTLAAVRSDAGPQTTSGYNALTNPVFRSGDYLVIGGLWGYVGYYNVSTGAFTQVAGNKAGYPFSPVVVDGSGNVYRLWDVAGGIQVDKSTSLSSPSFTTLNTIAGYTGGTLHDTTYDRYLRPDVYVDNANGLIYAVLWGASHDDGLGGLSYMWLAKISMADGTLSGSTIALAGATETGPTVSGWDGYGFYSSAQFGFVGKIASRPYMDLFFLNLDGSWESIAAINPQGNDGGPGTDFLQDALLIGSTIYTIDTALNSIGDTQQISEYTAASAPAEEPQIFVTT